MGIEAIKVFYCYAHEDKMLRDELEKHLKPLERLNQITGWYDRDIRPGEEWERVLHMQLNMADVLLLLISSDFFNSDFCYSIEMKEALRRHNSGDACIILIILRSSNWEITPIGKLQVLPSEAKPVSLWRDRDEAFLDVVKGIEKAIKDFIARSYEEALVAYNQAIHLYPEMLLFSREKIEVLKKLHKNGEVLATYDQIIQSSPALSFYMEKADFLESLQKHEDALTIYEELIKRWPNEPSSYHKKSLVLQNLGRFGDARKAYKEAEKKGFKESGS